MEEKEIYQNDLGILAKNFNLANIYVFCFKNRVEVVVLEDGTHACYINNKGAWSTEMNAISALVIGIKNYRENFEKITDLIKNQKDLDPVYKNIVNEEFWNLL